MKKTNGRKLVSTTYFVLEQKDTLKEVDKLSFFEIQTRINEFYDKTVHHATQMKRVLEKRMFVPTDNDGNVLQEPLTSDYDNYCHIDGGNVVDFESYNEAVYQHTQAKEHVLFKGFYSVDEKTVSNGEVEIIFGNLITLMIHRNHGSEEITKEKMFIEDLVDYNLTITDGVQGNNI